MDSQISPLNIREHFWHKYDQGLSPLKTVVHGMDKGETCVTAYLITSTGSRLPENI